MALVWIPNGVMHKVGGLWDLYQCLLCQYKGMESPNPLRLLQPVESAAH